MVSATEMGVSGGWAGQGRCGSGRVRTARSKSQLPQLGHRGLIHQGGLGQVTAGLRDVVSLHRKRGVSPLVTRGP